MNESVVNVQNPNADFRRAFPLDSRSVWIEQQNVHNIILPRDNFPIGPGDYSPIKPPRHISTPSLGGSRDHFKTFNSGLASRSGSRISNRARSPVKEPHPSVREDVEYKSVFHNYGNREPLDPKNRTTATPGVIIGPADYRDGFLKVSGKEDIRGFTFGANNIPFGERTKSKLALPDYDVKDSIVYKRVPLGCHTTEQRLKYFSVKDDTKPHDPSITQDRPWRNCATSEVFERQEKRNKEFEENSVAHSTTRKKLDKRPIKLKLDTSCYKQNMKAKRANGCIYGNLPSLDPSNIDRTVRVNTFGRILALPRPHNTIGIPSKVYDSLSIYE